MNEKISKLSTQLQHDQAFLVTDEKNLFYYTGFDGEGTLLAEEDKATIITDSRYTEAAKKTAPGCHVANIAEGMENIVSKDIKKLFIEETNISLATYRTYQKKLSWIEFADGGKTINKTRIIKNADEISKIKIAADIATNAFSKALEHIKPGVSEREIALIFEIEVKKAGASALSFETIVASGPNSSMPHARASERKFCDGDFVTLDFGCIYQNYCSDMTRTIGIGNINDEQKNIYEIVRRAQEAGVQAAVAGAKCKDVDAVARNIIKECGYGDCFGHSLGHGVGLNVHEMPRLSSMSEDILEDFMVVSCEPGIYIEGKFGVRIEDLLVINGQNCTNLSDFTKELIII